MRPIRIALACLVGTLAFSAMVAANAMAKDVESGPAAFADTGTGEAELGNDVVNIKCKKHFGKGEVTTARGGVGGSATYESCEAEGKSLKCTAKGKKEGEIETEALSGEIGWINKAKHEAGVDYSATAGSTAPLAQFNCGGVVGEVKVYGSVISKVTSPLNVMSETSTQTFEGPPPGETFKNNPSHLEGEPEDILESEFATIAPGHRTASEQKQSDTFTNHGGDCSVKKEKEKCKLKDLTEIGTVEVKCEGESCSTATRTQPEYGRCVKKKEGLYKDKNCSEAGEIKKGKKKGKYEFETIT